MKKYEAIFIIDNQKNDDGSANFIKETESLIKSLKGIVHETEDLGIRQFAHPVNKKTAGHYISIVTTLPEDKVVELKEKFRLDPNVFRVEVFSCDKPENYEAQPESKEG